MAITLMAIGARNILDPSNTDGRYSSYGGATADPTGVNDSTQAILDALNMNRGMGPSSGNSASPVSIYIPSGTYKVTQGIIIWGGTTFFGEPSAPPTIKLSASNSNYATTGSGWGTGPGNPFFVTSPSAANAAYSRNWSVRADGTHQSTNNTFFIDIHSINFIVDTGNPGCTDVMRWACAQECGIRDCNFTRNDNVQWVLINNMTGGGNSIIGCTFTGGANSFDHSNSQLTCRNCTFSKPVIQGASGTGWQFSLIHCTLNGGFVCQNGYNFTFDDCIFGAGQTFTPNSGRYHIENTLGFVQKSSSLTELRYNGSTIAGTDTRLDGLATGHPYPNPATPYPTGAAVNIKAMPAGFTSASGNGSTNDGPAIQAAINGFSEIFFPPGTYATQQTITVPAGKTLIGANRNLTYITNYRSATFVAGSLAPTIALTGFGSSQPITMYNLGIGAGAGGSGSGGTYMKVDCPVGSYLCDINFKWFNTSNITDTPAFNMTSGGLLWENSDTSFGALFPPGNVIHVGIRLASATGPTYIFGVSPQHFVGPSYQLAGANHVYCRDVQSEASNVGMTITNCSDVNLGSYSLDNGGGVSPYLISVTNSNVALFGLLISNNSQCIVNENGTNYGPTISGGSTNFAPMDGFVRAAASAIPTVSASAATNVTSTGATLNGIIAANGGSSITLDGFQWGTTTSYGNTLNATTVPSGNFSTSISGLTNGVTYHFRAFANNSTGQGFSGDQQFVANTSAWVQSVLGQPVPTTPVTTMSATFSSAQTVGNSNVVAISFNSITANMAAVNPVRDSAGNVYQVASPMTRNATDSQVVYWCPNIVSATAGSNTVTATFDSAPYASLRASEYQNISSIESHREQSGTGLTASVLSVSTLNSADVIVVAANAGVTVSSVAPFTERLNASPFGSDFQDYQPGVVVSNVTAPTNLSSSSNWIENLVVFSPSVSTPSAPSVSTPFVSNLTSTSATLNSTVTSAGTQPVTSDGFNYGTTTSYGISPVGSTVQTGSFSANITGLTPGQTYHFQSFSVNSVGTGVSVDQTFSAPSSTATPSLVQHTSSASNSNSPDGPLPTGNPGILFKIRLPNPSHAGNCLILEVTGRVTTQPTVTDNVGTNTWTHVNSVNDGSARTSIFVCSNVAANTQRMVVTFSTPIYNAHFACSEFCNVSTSYGSSALHTSATSTISPGSIANVVMGDLVWMCGYSTQNANGFSSNITHIASSSGFTLLSADVFVGTVAQYSTTVAGTVTASATLSGSTDAFNCVSVVLQASSQGSQASPGIRIVRTQSVCYNKNKAMQFPSTGNLIYGSTCFGTSLAPLAFPAGWTAVGNSTFQGGFVTGINSPTLSFTVGGAASGTMTLASMVFYDISGAASSPVGTWATQPASGQFNFSGSGDQVLVTLSPQASNSLGIWTIAVGNGVVGQSATATQCMMDTVNYGNAFGARGDMTSGNQTGPDLMDNSDGYGHMYLGAAGTPTVFQWNILNAGADQIWGMAQEFKAAPVVVSAPSVSASAATSITTSTATLNGSVISNGLVSVTSDGFNWGTTTSYGNSSSGATVQSGAFIANIGGLTPATTYHFQSFAVNSQGTGASTDQTFITSAPPSVPTGLTTTVVNSSEIDLAWTASTDTGAGQAGNAQSLIKYSILRSVGAGSNAFASVATTNAGIVAFNDTGLAFSTVYNYKVESVDTAGNTSAPTSAVTATTQAPVLGTPLFIQRAINSVAAPGGGSITCPVTTSLTAAGNLLVVYIGTLTSGSMIASVTDNKGSVYTPAFNSTSFNASIFCYHCLNGMAGVTTLTVVSSATPSCFNLDVAFYEFSATGISTLAWSLDKNSFTGTNNGTTAASTGATATTTHANEAIVSACAANPSMVTAGTSGFTGIVMGAHGWSEYDIVSATGVYTGTFTLAPFSASGGYVQGNMLVGGTSAPGVSTLSVSFTSNQAFGNSNVVAVSFNNATTKTIASVTDSQGNTYSIASALLAGSGDSQAVYYCSQVLAGGNAVTVTLPGNAQFLSVRIAEYSGIGLLDNQSQSFGTGLTASVPPITMTNAGDVVIVATCCTATISGASPGFTDRLNGLNFGGFGSDLQDVHPGVVTAYTGPIPLTQSSGWVENMVMFLPKQTWAAGIGSWYAAVAPYRPMPVVKSLSSVVVKVEQISPGISGFVQTANHLATGSGAISCPVTLQATLAGDLLIVYVGALAANAAITSVTDNRSNVYTMAFSNISSNVSLFCYQCLGCIAGVTTVTVLSAASPAAGTLDVSIYEIAGPGSWFFDKFSVASTNVGTATASSGATPSTTQTGEIVVAACFANGTNVTSGTSGFTGTST